MGLFTRLAQYAQPPPIQEARIDAEMDLALDSLGWAPQAPSAWSASDLRPEVRRELVLRSRIFYVQDPLCHHAVRSFTSYCVGKGFSIKATRRVNGEHENIQLLADAFWGHPENAMTFSIEKQHKWSNKLNIDGEIFFALFPGPDVTRVRVLGESLQIAEIITNPDDDQEVWYYLRRWGQGTNMQVALYPDVGFHKRPLPTLTAQHRAAANIPDDATIRRDAYLMHVAVNTVGQRGNPLLTTGLEWARAVREFLQDRVTLNKSWAEIAWRRTVSGPASAVAQLAAQRAMPDPRTHNFRTRPVASTLTQNKGVTWESENAQGGATNAAVEVRNLKLQFFISVGLPEHYFADGSNGTRATSKSMERPVELLLLDYQTLWKSVYERLFVFELMEHDYPFDPTMVRVDAPTISEDDTAIFADALVKIMSIMPEFDIDEVKMLLLQQLHLDDPQALLPVLQQRAQELYNQELVLAQAMAGFNATATTPDAPMGADGQPDHAAHAQALTSQIASYQKLIGMLTPGDSPSALPGVQHGPQFASVRPGASLTQRKSYPKGTRPTNPLGK